MRKTVYTCDECGKDAAAGQFQAVLDVAGKTVHKDACSKECMAKALRTLAESIAPDARKLAPFGAATPCSCSPVDWTMTPPDTSTPGPRTITCGKCKKTWTTEIKTPGKSKGMPAAGEGLSQIVDALAKVGIVVNLVEAAEKWSETHKDVVLAWLQQGANPKDRPDFLPTPSVCACSDQLHWVVEGTEAVCTACWAAWPYTPAAAQAAEARAGQGP